MRLRLRAPVVLSLCLLVQGCQQYGPNDVELLERFGGDYVLSGEAWARYQAPVGAVYLTERDLSDADFAAVFPAVEQMDPMVLLLRGNHSISDESIKVINKLNALEHLDVSGTKLTPVGLSNLRLMHLRVLILSPHRITEAEAQALAKQFPGVDVRRWAPAPPS